MELMGTNLQTTVFIGDQIFTDVYGAKRIGMRNILVKPIHRKEEIQIVLKRIFERPILKEFRQKNKRKKRERNDQKSIERNEKA
jgi:predicted HAD superfamily phosphohydrolase YqeG